MDNKIYTRLSIMMFLQLFVWGAWFVTLGTYLSARGFTGAEIGTAYLTNNIGAILSPLFIGLIADRFFSAERIMAALHIVGGAVLFMVADFATTASIIGGLLLYNLCYMPTLALANAVSFHQMSAPDNEFPKIRVWGTVGWIAAGLVISFVLAKQIIDVEATSIPLKMGAFASFIMGLYCLTLPNTPPQNTDQAFKLKDAFSFDALALLKDKSFAVFALCSLLISIPLAFYYAFANLYFNELGMASAAAKMSLGQVSEVFFMLLMPFFFRRLGVKWMLFVGMAAWIVRYALFAAGDMDTMVWMLYGGILLHGICYDFFFVTGQIYVDGKADKKIRSSAQSFITLITYGFGLAIGSYLSGIVVDIFTIDGVKNWAAIWLTPCVIAAGVTLLFVVTFKDEKVDVD